MSLAWSLYRAVAPCLGALAPAARVVASPAERELWSERLGEIDWPGGSHAWIHAASLGEALAVGPLVRELTALQPGARLWLTSTTRAGRARLLGLSDRVSLAPMDSPQSARRFFSGLRPERVFLLETELWPHWLLRARAEGIPVAVVSARLSARSVRHYASLGPEFRSLIGGLSAVLCQSHADAERWIKAGAAPERTAVVGNLKNDALPEAAPVRGAARTELGLDRDRPVLVLGSVRPGEVKLIARAWRDLPESVRDRWQVVAVPRHPRASADLMGEARAAGIALLRRDGPGAPRSPAANAGGASAGHPPDRAAAGAWFWEDRLGVLARYYAVADVALVGGSLLPYGGHNPLEPAACGAAVIMGPHFESQRAAVTALAAREAIRIAADPASLHAALLALLGEESVARTAGRAAFAVAAAQRGGARRALALLAAWRLWPAT